MQIYEWSRTWEMEFHAKKMPCSRILENDISERVIEEKDLGVLIQDDLSP